MLTIFINKLLFICNKHTPLPNITKYRYPIHIKKLLNKCRHLHNIICDENSRMNWRLAQLYVDIKIKKYNIDLESKVLSSNNKSTFYKFINKKLHSSNFISPLYNEIDNSISSSDFDKASCLSHQYSSVFNKSYNINIPILSISSHISSSLFSYPTTPEVLHRFLCLLPSKFNNSQDGIPKGLLKKLSFELCHPLSIIFTNILDSGICPDIWKISHIIPMFKKGDTTKPANYRPISILPSTLILFEKILSNNLTFYLLTKCQYGFLAGKSTELQLISFYKKMYKARDEFLISDIAYIDLAKAFDKVSHSKLLHKLSYYGVSGNLYKWLKSNLLDRKQRVKINDSFSNFSPVISGVPQGSVVILNLY